MSAKSILVFCAQAFFIQSTLGQCISRAAVDASGFASPYGYDRYGYDRIGTPGLAYDGLAGGWAGRGLGCDGYYAPAMEFTATSGGGLPVTSISAISPTGIKVISENAYEGALSVTGELPFLGAVAMDGRLPTAGVGAIDYGCGNGIIAMLNEGIGPAAYSSNAAIAPGAFGPNAAYGPGPYGVGSGFGPGAGYGFGSASAYGSGGGIAQAANFAPANRLGCGGCGRGMLY